MSIIFYIKNTKTKRTSGLGPKGLAFEAVINSQHVFLSGQKPLGLRPRCFNPATKHCYSFIKTYILTSANVSCVFATGVPYKG